VEVTPPGRDGGALPRAAAGTPRAEPLTGGIDYSLLPRDRTFAQLLWPFVAPYLLYVAMGVVPQEEIRSILRLLEVGAVLFIFRRQYRFGPALRAAHWAWLLGGAAAATALWALSLRLCLEFPWWRGRFALAEAAHFSPLYIALRGFNSALLVPIFEELLCRVYLPELIQAGRAGKKRLPVADLSPGAGPSPSPGPSPRDWLDASPRPLDKPPLTAAAFLGATAFFAFGHDGPAFLPAILYFGFTGWIYARTRSFRVVVGIHGLVNLAIAVGAAWKPELRFLWA
jgi:hypothetical protein